METNAPGPMIDAVVAGMQDRLDGLAADAVQRTFLGTYLRTTIAVGEAVHEAHFEDPDWVDQWDAAFAQLYLLAFDAQFGAPGRTAPGRAAVPGRTAPGRAAVPGPAVPRPWRLAFEAPVELPPLRHLLLGLNAHVNYDLPQALLAVISDADFEDQWLVARRRRDHERIDTVLAARVRAEDLQLASSGPRRSVLDRALTGLNRLGSQRFLREARHKVWHNTLELQQARLQGPAAYQTRLAELELLCAARIADLLAPGQVLLRLAVAGFGVVLPPP
jgi:hypothetical protein